MKIVEDWCETCGVDKEKHGHPGNPCKQFVAHVWDPLPAARYPPPAAQPAQEKPK